MPEDPEDPSVARRARVRELFARGLRLDVAARGAFLLQVAAEDERLAAELRDLLDAAGEATDPRVSSTATDELFEKLVRSPKLDPRRYEIEGEIGKGGMGAILRIRDQYLNRRLAMKVLLERPASADEQDRKLARQLLGRFLEEAQIASQLDHPGIVPVHELGLDQNGKVYFTMRLVKGRTAAEAFTLAQAGEDGWTRTRALEVVLKVCDTMAYAHDKGVVHRDLKPQNVMVGRFGEVYVMDWGLAKVLGQDDQHDLRIRPAAEVVSELATVRSRDAEGDAGSSVVSMDGQQLGTPHYMPPEQARSEPIDHRADVYAIGAMLYELLTGRAPYATPGLRQPAYRILRDVVEGPPRRIEELQRDVPGELVAIVDKAMARAPADRYAGVAELATDLRAYVDQRVVRAYRTGAVVEMRMWMRRNRALAGALAAALLALLLGIVGTTTMWHEALGNQVVAEQRLGDVQQARNELTAKAGELEASLHEATGLRLLAQANAVMQDDPTLGLLIAEAGADIRPGLDANRTLLRGLEASREQQTWTLSQRVPAWVHGCANGRVACMYSDGWFEVWNLRSAIREARVDLGTYFNSQDLSEPPLRHIRVATRRSCTAAFGDTFGSEVHCELVPGLRHIVRTSSSAIAVDIGGTPRVTTLLRTAPDAEPLFAPSADPGTAVALDGSTVHVFAKSTVPTATEAALPFKPLFGLSTFFYPGAHTLACVDAWDTATPTADGSQSLGFRLRVLPIEPAASISASQSLTRPVHAAFGGIILPGGDGSTLAVLTDAGKLAFARVDVRQRKLGDIHLVAQTEDATWIQSRRLAYRDENGLVHVIDDRREEAFASQEPWDGMLACHGTDCWVTFEGHDRISLRSATTCRVLESWTASVADVTLAAYDDSEDVLTLVDTSGRVIRLPGPSHHGIWSSSSKWAPEAALEHSSTPVKGVNQLGPADLFVAAGYLKRARGKFREVGSVVTGGVPEQVIWSSSAPPSTDSIWSPETGSRLATASTHQRSGLWRRFSSDHSKFADGVGDHRLLTWSVLTGTPDKEWHLQGHSLFAWRPEANVFCAIPADVDRVTLRESNATERVLADLGELPRSLAYDASGASIIVVNHAGDLLLVNRSAATPSVGGLASPPVTPLRDASVAPHSGTMILVDEEDRVQLRSPDGDRVLFTEPKRTAHLDYWTCADTGDLLGLGYGNGIVRVLHLPDGKELLSLRPNGYHRPLGIAFAQDGSLLAVTTDDAVARVYRVADGAQTHEFVHRYASPLECGFAADLSSLVVRTTAPGFVFWPLDLRAEAKRAAPRELTPDERAQYGLPAVR